MAYCSVADVKRYLGISGSGDDLLLTSLIAAAQKQIDNYCRRTFEAGADSTRYFTPGRDTEGATLWLDADLAAITTVTNGDSVVVSAAQYTTEPRNTTPYYQLRLLSSAGKAWTYSTDPDGAIRVLGKWAYSVDAPDDIAQACVRLAGFLYRQKDKQMFDVQVVDGGQYVTPLAMPNDVKAVLAPYRRL